MYLETSFHYFPSSGRYIVSRYKQMVPFFPLSLSYSQHYLHALGAYAYAQSFFPSLCISFSYLSFDVYINVSVASRRYKCLALTVEITPSQQAVVML